ncbi:unnamed protein product [Arctia plantaginis]|uniref:Major facilitator superfamily (MFS) profile domain-containing protein n=1 Tax=Arctia plantaginis TaxID=874455 RepID=A0A8S0Z1B6_ARCPL|nr:unnamed protein product [Arctia plantaginis]CAB3235130.1 unnamed protein product [Arctia plantaginis]
MSSEKNETLSEGECNNNNDYKYEKDFQTALPQFLAVSAKNLLLLGYGMTLGFSTILIPAVQSPRTDEILYLTKSEISWISSMNLIVVPIGCALSGLVTSPLGRKKAMQMVNIPFCIAWLLFHFSTTTGHLYGALFLTGLAGGLLEAPVLTYVAEITQPHIRGALAATSSLCIIIGVFTQFLLGLLLYWRIVALVNITFTVLAIIALCFVPESPHWLVSKNRNNDARKTYAVSIFQMLQTPIDKYYATLILGLLQIIGSTTCVLLVHYTGKRPLTFISTGGAGVCCILVAAFDIYIKTAPQSSETNLTSISPNDTSPSVDDQMQNPYSWMPITLLMLLALISHTGLRLLPWILIGEVFSAKTRTAGAGFASAVGYVFGFLTNKMYINMVDTLSIWGTYGLYGIVSFIGCIVFYFILPETEGKKLNDIENHFTGRKKLNNKVYRSKRIEKSRMHELKGATNLTFEGDTSKL